MMNMDVFEECLETVRGVRKALDRVVSGLWLVGLVLAGLGLEAAVIVLVLVRLL